MTLGRLVIHHILQNTCPLDLFASLRYLARKIFFLLIIKGHCSDAPANIHVELVIHSPERKQDVAAEGRVAAPGAGSAGAGDSGSESAPAADDDCGSSTASSGFGSLTKRRPHGQYPSSASLLNTVHNTSMTL